MAIFPGNKLPGYDRSVPPGHIRRHADTPGERAKRQTRNARHSPATQSIAETPLHPQLAR